MDSKSHAVKNTSRLDGDEGEPVHGAVSQNLPVTRTPRLTPHFVFL